MTNFKFGLVIVLAAAFAEALPVQAAVVTYLGADDTVTTLADMTNSLAAAAAFNTAVPGTGLIDFESSVPADVTILGGTIKNDSGCGALCGFNTTVAGQNFLWLFGGTTTITFATPIDAFGMFITGLQSREVFQETLTFDDGSTNTINVPTANFGGGAFLGFTDFGQNILSVTYDATEDIVALDDLRYHSASPVVPGSTVPEPLTLSLFGAGLAGAVAMRRRKKKTA